jgi:ribosomal protein L22
MAFSPSKRSEDIRTALKYAVRRAELLHQIPQDKLVVETAWTGKNMSSPRVRHHAKGRAGTAHWRSSEVSVQVREMDTHEEAKALREAARQEARRVTLSPRGY